MPQRPRQGGRDSPGFSVICGVNFFIPAMCIVYVCSVLTSSIITSLENVSSIVSLLCLSCKSFGYSFLSSCGLVWDNCHAVGLLCFFFFFFFVDGVPMFVFYHMD